MTAGAVSASPPVEQRHHRRHRAARAGSSPAGSSGPVNHDVIRNPKVRVVSDDARHFLQTTTEKFDAITSDPLDPWVKGAATLYTREFFEVARAHLNPGGVMTLYVQLFESSHEAVKSEVATFFEAFPQGMIFGNIFEGHAIDSVLVGQAEAPSIWVDEIETLLRSPGFAPVDSLADPGGFYGAVDLFGNYAGRASDLEAGWPTRKSTTIAICGCSTWPGLASTCTRATTFIMRSCRTARFPTICSSRRTARSTS